MKPKPLCIFVLADTHDRLPANVLGLAKEADEIWHLGDVCAPRIVDELELLGPPVTVVQGNCDEESRWPLVVKIERHGVRFWLEHIPPSRPPPDCDVVLHGHTHVPRDDKIDGVRFLNPGCVTRPNRGAPPSAAWLAIDGTGALRWELASVR